MHTQNASCEGARWAPEVSASILGCDLGDAAAEACSAIAAGAASIHADVMDGHFVPNISFGPDLIARVYAACQAPMTVHLMVERPEPLLPAFLETGAPRFLVHPEATPHVRRALDIIREAGYSPGIALNPGTPLCAGDAVYEHVDEVLVMTVNPGWGGQRMMFEQLGKVRELRRRMEAGAIPAFDISVDGGVSPATAGEVIAAGANVLVAGTALFGSSDRSAVVRALRCPQPIADG